MYLQVRFGVLNAGNFGVSQSRKRTFIWGVAPGDLLPQWPAPLHVFRSPQLTINLPGNVQACARVLTMCHHKLLWHACAHPDTLHSQSQSVSLSRSQLWYLSQGCCSSLL